MLRLHCSDLWTAVEKLSASSTHRHAAVAYVSDDSNLRFVKGDTLVVDASPEAIKTQQTSAKVLMRAHRNGAEVFSLPGLHAKLMVFDRTAVIGSANISRSSKDRLLEAAVVTDNPSLVSAARNVVAQLRLKSRRLDGNLLRELLGIPVIPHAFPTGGRKGRPWVVRPKAGDTWLAGTYDLDVERYKGERRAEQGRKEAKKLVSRPSSDVEWIRYPRSANISKANEGDWLIQMWGPEEGGRLVRVYRRAPILRMQKEPTCVRIYVEDFRNAASEALKWSTFHTIARQAAIPERRMRRLSVGTLDDVKADALESFWKLALARAPGKKK